jgi:hypothetical protein
MVDACNKTLEKIVWVKEKQKFMLRKETRTYNYDTINQHRLGKNPIAVKEELFDLSVLGEKEPKKEVKVPIILRKQNVNTETLETMTAYFTQDLSVKVLSDSIYKFQYVTVCENRIFIHNLNSGQTVGLALSGEQQGIEKKLLGTEKRLTEAEATELMESGIPCFEKFQGEYRILI